MTGKTAVIAAGGTGGHMFPASAAATELKARGWRIVLMTDGRGERYAKDFPCDEKHFVDAATFAGLGPLAKIWAALSIGRGVVQAAGLLGKIKPAIVIGFGGYPSLPAMAGAVLRGIPRVIHEQNAVLGRVNRRFSARADCIAAGFENPRGVAASAQTRVHAVGNPVRPAVMDAAATPFTMPEEGGPLNLLIFGGSQGARIIANTAPGAVAALPKTLRTCLIVTHQAREEDVERVTAAYEAAGVKAEVATFFSDLPARMAAAHLVVARAGASTVTELGIVGRPSVLIPLAIAMDDHQTENARTLTDRDAAFAISEADLTVESLSARLENLLSQPARLAEMAGNAKGAAPSNAAVRLAEIAERLADQNSIHFAANT